jgi:hypothetical protein
MIWSILIILGLVLTIEIFRSSNKENKRLLELYIEDYHRERDLVEKLSHDVERISKYNKFCVDVLFECGLRVKRFIPPIQKYPEFVVVQMKKIKR